MPVCCVLPEKLGVAQELIVWQKIQKQHKKFGWKINKYLKTWFKIKNFSFKSISSLRKSTPRSVIFTVIAANLSIYACNLAHHCLLCPLYLPQPTATAVSMSTADEGHCLTLFRSTLPPLPQTHTNTPSTDGPNDREGRLLVQVITACRCLHSKMHTDASTVSACVFSYCGRRWLWRVSHWVWVNLRKAGLFATQSQSRCLAGHRLVLCVYHRRMSSHKWAQTLWATR